MKIKHFTDTDTALLEFSTRPATETRAINDNLYIDFDEQGNMVSMTIEHASAQAGMRELTFERIEA